MTARLQGKKIIVIGGTSGMGAAEAKMFMDEGAKVVIASRSADKCTNMFGDISGKGIFVKHDVTQEADWLNLITQAEKFFEGPIDALVNNAGILVEKGLEETSLQEYEFLVGVMQTGAFLGMKYAAESIKKGGNGGAIINVSSTAGIVGFKGIFAYTAAKWGMRGMTKAAALDLAEYNIRVNSIHPGDTWTPMIDELGYTPDAYPLGRFAEADEIASLALFLVSDESRFITGAEHIIDGGYTAQ